MFSVLKAINELATRTFDESEHNYRSKFERDRDRILYSKAFRRLSGKTQVFIAGNDDHLRTRLTHTLEVVQIATTISKRLELDIPLTEAISYGHDLGHTPFGHVGERTINYIMNGCYSIRGTNSNLQPNEQGFKHNWQSVRVMSDLEVLNKDYYGLNPTNYTLWGVVNHSSLKYKSCRKRSTDTGCNLRLQGNNCDKTKDDEFCLGFYDKYLPLIADSSWSLEALVVAIADEIAQRHHDIEDGIETGLIDKNELIEKFKNEFNEFLVDEERQLLRKIQDEDEQKYYSAMLSKLIVNFLTTRVINDTIEKLNELVKKYHINSAGDFYSCHEDIYKSIDIFKLVDYSEDFKAKEKNFHKYLMTRILNSQMAQKMDGKAGYIIRQLFKAYVSNPQQLPDKTIGAIYKMKMGSIEFDEEYSNKSEAVVYGELREKLENDHYRDNSAAHNEVLLRGIADYISGMTDVYAMSQYKSLYEG
ncbi:MAG: dNTP triphosphohydrolase [Firmicutes bacterium]|nr:dNTP triphosphohydrolase [Bacillota bacterium]